MAALTLAETFFTQLEKFSARARQYLNGKPDLSPWGESRLSTSSGYPDGIVLHYTAGPTLESAVKWLCNVKDQCGSAHVVVADCSLDWARPLMIDTPLVAALPATVVQLRLPNTMAYHATVANRTHYGIEMANVGPMPPRVADPTNAQDRSMIATNCVIAAGQVFRAYTLAQLKSTAQVGRYVAALGGNIGLESIVGHEHVQGPATKDGGGHDKRDPGVCFNFSLMRQAMVGQPSLSNITDASLETLGTRMGFVLDPTTASMQTKGLMQSAYAAGTAVNRETRMAAQLVALGYHVYGTETTSSQADNIRYFTGAGDNIKKNISTAIVFQRLMGLVPDGVLGPKTADALAARLSDRWLKRTMLEAVA